MSVPLPNPGIRFRQFLRFGLLWGKLFFGILLISCTRDTLPKEELPDLPMVTGEKIKGGSILQVWVLSFGGNIGTDIAERTNANWVALCPLAGLERNNGGGIRPFNFPVSEETYKLKTAMEKTIASGVENIMVKPLTSFYLVRGDRFWGDFYLETEEDWLDMERAFSEYIMGFAALSAEFPQFRMLSIGNELREFATRRPQFFRDLITGIREAYPDLMLTYSANWDEYERITFWEDLDYIGVNSYFPLVETKTPTVEEVSNAFEPVKRQIEVVSRQSGRPVLFTEYGFRSIDYTVRRPWDHGDILTGVRVNLQAQANAYTAFYNVFWDEPWVAGGFFWEWFTESDLDNPYYNSDSNGWYINGKPAEQVVREQYSEGAD